MILPSLYLKLGIAGVLLAVGMAGGCRWQAARDAKALAACQEDRDNKAAALAITAETLRQIDAATVEAKADADKRAKAAAELVEQAKADQEEYARRSAAIDQEIERAKRNPGCRAQLEQRSCVALH